MVEHTDFDFKCTKCDFLLFTMPSERVKRRIFGPRLTQCPKCENSLKMPWKHWEEGTIAEKAKFTFRQILGTFLVTVTALFFIGLPLGAVLDQVCKINLRDEYAVYANYTVWFTLFITTQINVRKNKLFIISKVMQW